MIHKSIQHTTDCHAGKTPMERHVEFLQSINQMNAGMYFHLLKIHFGKDFKKKTPLQYAVKYRKSKIVCIPTLLCYKYVIHL